MEVMKVTRSPKGARIAHLFDGRFVAQLNVMELIFCEPVPEGFRTTGPVHIAGIMMRTEEDFIWGVEHMNAE